jgi:hypothetical protein
MPPDNGGYMIAAYVVTAVVLFGYTGQLWRRARAVVKEERERGGTA